MNKLYILVEFPSGNTYEVTEFDENGLSFNTDDLSYPFYSFEDFNDEEYKFFISVSSSSSGHKEISNNIPVTIDFLRKLLRGS